MVQIPGNRDREPGLAHGIQLRLFGLCFSHPAGFGDSVSTLIMRQPAIQTHDVFGPFGIAISQVRRHPVELDVTFDV